MANVGVALKALRVPRKAMEREEAISQVEINRPDRQAAAITGITIKVDACEVNNYAINVLFLLFYSFFLHDMKFLLCLCMLN